MHHFTIRDMENLCGVKAHTLRIWEQRYQLIIPKRKESFRRIYDNDDLKHLLRIAFLYQQGWKISKIATLSPEAMVQEVRKAEITEKNHKSYSIPLIEAALDFNETYFAQLLDEMIQKIGFEKCITEVCYPFLQKIGMLWVTNNIIPAQEHFSSYLIQNKIIAETDKLPAADKHPHILLFSPQGEYHELPLLFINYLFKKNGWSTLYLGSNIRNDVLEQFKNLTEIKYLFVHLITNFTGMYADDYFDEVCRSFKTKIIIATGGAVHQVQRNFLNLRILKSDKEIFDFIKLGRSNIKN